MFKPKGDPLGGPIKSCAYQFINGGYYLQFSARRDESETNCQLSSVSFGTDSMMVEQGKKYKLFTRKEGFASGKYTFYSDCGVFINYITEDSLQGELNIIKLDEVHRIISGTFWFDAISSAGEKVEVREGRFDMNYTL